ncbi:MAG: hypothetical protein ACLFTT_01840 [Candidatus Hydrogenedentota bacterium]
MHRLDATGYVDAEELVAATILGVAGAEVKAATLTQDYTFADFSKDNPDAPPAVRRERE